jgi:hypothetical protein
MGGGWGWTTIVMIIFFMKINFNLPVQMSFADSSVSGVCYLFTFQNHKANFNQTWHKPSLGKVDSVLLK